MTMIIPIQHQLKGVVMPLLVLGQASRPKRKIRLRLICKRARRKNLVKPQLSHPQARRL